ncbi:ParA family protein [Streptomyces sp. H39-C1]|uniref:ParA family protein n=1 Tax=Streptomyces sp. H39-C1 TaxID=3004355 RepID=UPI0022B077A4|nr:ParA family protein [Streptomyces sp. H39-C1]MCZ4098043.1 ParA family protein [Streptomyces sp. H39-C1]
MPTGPVPLDVVDLSRVKAAVRRRMQLMAEGLHAAKVFVVINGKGGVGKSSLSAALAVALSRIGLRVLLIEMDEQGNNGEDLGTTGGKLADGGEAQAAAILDGKPLIPTGEARPGLFVIPGGAVLEEVIEELYCQRRLAARMDSPEDQTAWMGMYAVAIDALRDDFDVIILDVAPGSEVLQLQALVAGDMVLIPSKSDPSSRKGLRTVAQRFAQARALNPKLRLLGVVVFATNVTATKVQTNIKSQLSADLQGAAPVFEQTIRHVESAAVACRSAGKVPQELRGSKDLTPGVRQSMKALAGDYQSLAIEVMQAKAALDRADEMEDQAV